MSENHRTAENRKLKSNGYKPSVLSELLDGLDRDSLGFYLNLAQQHEFLIFTCEYDENGNRHPIFKIPTPEQRHCINYV